MTAAPPDIDDLRAWLPGAQVDDAAAADALQAALEAQSARCRTDPYTAGLRIAALRRAARILAARHAPLGTVDNGELGAVYLPATDPETEALERPHLLGPFA